jgi:LmbE family N-acetylglucosaminyl deacetylase
MKSGVPFLSAAPFARLVVGALLFAGAGRAAEAPANDAGRPGEAPAGAAILQQLRSFATTGRVLHLGAHPDDENTQLIAWLSRGRGYQAAYLSITRGDGGQNELGPEFDEKLGVARTQELLAARRVDGGRQFFTRAIDFGYSKSPEETLRFWDNQAVLSDVVRVIRTFRPDVIITRFPIPPGSGGHGHHTASAILAVEAFKLAGDPNAFPDQLREGLAPWQPKRVFWNTFSWNNAPLPLSGPVVKEDIGGKDPVTGESFGTIANQSRGMHKTQGLGFFSNRTADGPRPESFLLLAGDAPANDIMEGVDTTWSRVPGGAEIGAMAGDLIAHFKPDNPAACVPTVLALREKLNKLPDDPLVTDKRRQLDRILRACLGLTVESTLPSAEVVPGETLALHHTATVSSAASVRWTAVRYPTLKSQIAIGANLVGGQPATRDTSQTLPTGTPPSQPYWLREPGSAGVFRVDDPSLIGRPENPPVLPVEYVFEVGGQTLVVADEPVQLVAGASEAQARRRLAVIPPVSLGFDAGVEIFSPAAGKPVVVEVTAARANSSGTLRLETPAGWQVAPAAQPFQLARVGDKTRLSFSVTAPAHTGSAVFSAVADVGGVRCATERELINYAHIPLQLLQPPARLKAVSLDLAVRAHRVGYLPGAGDSLAENLAQMGCEVTTLTGADLTPEKLRGLDAVVLGVRAFNIRTDLAANLPGLFAWVESGGTVVVQYNRPQRDKDLGPLGPYPLSIAGDAPQQRVTDENTPVTFLAPDHPALNTPNKITAADFEGWVQERGTYFPSSWDETHYTAVFAMNDPGEAPLKGSLLVARHGQGCFVYTGLAFFRQLPAGVPGAWRLFANLISLGK